MKQQVVFQIGRDFNDSPVYHSFSECEPQSLMVYGTAGSGVSNQMSYIVNKLITGGSVSGNYKLDIIDCNKYQESKYWVEGIKDNKHFKQSDNIKACSSTEEFMQVLKDLYDRAQKRYSTLKELNYKRIVDYNEVELSKMEYRVIVFTGLNGIFNENTKSAVKDDIDYRLYNLVKIQRAVGFFFIFDCSNIPIKNVPLFVKLSPVRIVLRCDADVSKFLTDTEFPAKIDKMVGHGYYYNTVLRELRKYQTGAVLDGKCGTYKETVKYEFVRD